MIADEQDLSAFRDLPFLGDAPEIPWGCESPTISCEADLTSRPGSPVPPVLRQQVRSQKVHTVQHSRREIALHYRGRSEMDIREFWTGWPPGRGV
jgi:hypothetical protein